MLTHSITLETDIEPEPIREVGDHNVEDSSAIIHVVNIDDFDDSTPDTIKSRPALSFRRKLLFTLILSIILHTLAFYLISLRIQIPSFEYDVVKPIIVQAKLYTPPTPVEKPQETIEVIEPSSIAVPEVGELVVPEVVKETIEVEEPIPTQEPKGPIPEVIEPSRSIIEEPTTEPDIPDLEATQETLTETPTTQPRPILNNSAGRHMRTLNQRKQSSMASQAFKEYQYNQVHPEIKTESKTTLQLTPEEKRQIADEQLQESTKIEVDCKKNASKALRFISGIGGGTIKCQKNKEFKSFIKKRLEESNSSQ